MSDLLPKIIPFALLAVVIVLCMGLFNMLRNGSVSRSQNLMRWRVGLQFIAVIIIMAALYFGAR